jgi:putative flippase GtrA
LVAYLTFAALILVGLHFAVATLFGSLVGILLGFKLHGKLVFDHSGEGRFMRFVGISLLAYGLSLGIQTLSRPFMNSYLAGGLAAMLTVPVSYLLNRALVFRGKLKVYSRKVSSK